MGELWSLALRLWPHLLATATLLLATLALIHVLLYKRSAQATLAWAGLIALVPLLGAIFYILFGINRIRRAGAKLRDRRAQAKGDAAVDDPLERDFRDAHAAYITQALPLRFATLEPQRVLLERVTAQPLLSGNAITLLRDGDEAYPSMIEAISKAQRSVLLSSYIFELDEAGRPFVEALKAAHERGVRVHVIIDGVGSAYGWPWASRALARARVPITLFLPPLSPGRLLLLMNLRTHRKIMVVDGVVGFTGGINIRHHHEVKQGPEHPTHDAHFKLQGPIVFQLQRTLVDDWFFCEREVLRGTEYFPGYEAHGQTLARGIVDGPDEHYLNLQLAFLGAIAAATRHIVIITPYFTPDEAILSALEVAALRGVTIELFLPARSNLRFVDFASSALWEPLLESGVRIWLVGGHFDHAKLMVVDELWSLFGSGNWDARSLQLNFEFNVEAYDHSLANDILALAEQKRAVATELTLEAHRKRSALIRLREGVFKLLTPYL